MKFFAQPSLSVLAVCTANICRSPMVEGILREELKLINAQRKVRVDSAGTAASQAGHPTDGRAVQACAREGVDLRKCRARQVVDDDFVQFDYLLAVDNANREWLLAHCPEHHAHKISRLGDWASSGSVGDIPDPYYGSVAGFEETLALLHQSIDGFVLHLAAQLEQM